MPPVKSNNKETNVNSESDILIESLQDTIHILNKELINKENTINHQKNQELNKVTPPLNKVPSCEEQLTKIH